MSIRSRIVGIGRSTAARSSSGDRDELVVVARADNEAEGEFLLSLLRAENVPALTRRAPGFDVPDFLAAGPREVLVRASTAEIARDVLLPAKAEGG